MLGLVGILRETPLKTIDHGSRVGGMALYGRIYYLYLRGFEIAHWMVKPG